MRRMFSRAMVVLAISTMAALGADNSIGTWKLNSAKSKYTPAPMPVKSLTSVREAAPRQVAPPGSPGARVQSAPAPRG